MCGACTGAAKRPRPLTPWRIPLWACAVIGNQLAVATRYTSAAHVASSFFSSIGFFFATSDARQLSGRPPKKIVAAQGAQRPWVSRKARRLDFAERDAANRQMGKLGEQFAVALEQHRLRAVGR